MHPEDFSHMHHALRLAKRGLGSTAPNPSVGCVLVKEGRIVGRGWTGAGGRPHAETLAIAQAGTEAAGATAYVTLEPCAHVGRTPSCAQSLIDAKVARVVTACLDPDPRTNGQGLAMLKAAGIEVSGGVLQEEAKALNEGFFSRIQRRSCVVNMKIATSLDGRIAYPQNQPRWITGEHARACGHLLRAEHEVIVTGIGTALTDNPMLTCRVPGLEHRSPVRAILDSTLLLPESYQLAETANTIPTILITTSRARADKRSMLAAKGIKILSVPGEHITIEQALALLAAEGFNRVLLEGGTALSTSALQSGLVETLFWFRAPSVIGDKGKPAFTHLKADGMLKAYQRTETVVLREDVLEIYHKKGAT